MKVSIIAAGTIKEQYWNDAIAEYIKRLSPYCSVTITEVKEERFKDANSKDAILRKEGDRILKVLPNNALFIALDKEGKKLDSVGFSENIKEWTQNGQHIVFIIGGPLGLSGDVISKAHERISLSQMTFTHQMSRVILFEQLYRGVTILKGKTYHY